jgi:RNA polymerase sigma factor (TIGR02999 family)
MLLVYRQLRRLAAGQLRRERPDHTLQPTALVHEMYERVVEQTSVDWQNRAQFFAVAAQAMRRILVDHARERRARKRGGTWVKVQLDDGGGSRAPDVDVDVLIVDEALEELKRLDPRQEQILSLRCFAGMSVDETARALEVSCTTVKREWRMGRAWLHRRLERHRDQEARAEP